MARLTYGQDLQQKRKALRLSQSDLGKKLNPPVHQPTVSQWELGNATPSSEQKLQLAEILSPSAAETKSATPGPAPRAVSAPNAAAEVADIPSWLKSARSAAQLSVLDLAKRSGVSHVGIYNIESGKIRNPRRDTLKRLEKTLGRLETGKPQNTPRADPPPAEIEAEAEPPAPAADDISPRPPAAFGAWLAKSRARLGLSVTDLAIRSGVPRIAIDSIESGKTQLPHRTTIQKLEKALGKLFSIEAKGGPKVPASGLGAWLDFDPHRAADLPHAPGVYVLYDISNRPIYVGQANNLAETLATHRREFWFRPPIVQSATYVGVSDDYLRDDMVTVLIRFLKANAVLNRVNTNPG